MEVTKMHVADMFGACARRGAIPAGSAPCAQYVWPECSDIVFSFVRSCTKARQPQHLLTRPELTVLQLSGDLHDPETLLGDARA